jgi:TolB-like protein
MNRTRQNAAVPAQESPPRFDFSESIEILRQLTRVLDSDVFAETERLRRFLFFVVTRSLEQDHPSLDQRTIAVEVFDRTAAFNPVVDPIVRVEALRLRSKIREYYGSVGRNDPIVIDLAKRGYAPVIHKRPRETPDRTLSNFAGESHVFLQNGLPAAIAVLPFDDLTPDASLGAFCKSLTRSIMQVLPGETGLRVAASHSARQFKERSRSVREIGGEVGVEMLLEGSVQKYGGILRISSLLAATRTSRCLWSRVYERSLTNGLALQDEAARTIAMDLQQFLTTPPAQRQEIAGPAREARQ